MWRLGDALASQIEEDVGVTVTLHDYANVGGSAGDILRALSAEGSPSLQLRTLPDVLREAEVVVMFVNPLDSIDPAAPHDLEACFLSKVPATCPPEAFRQYSEDLSKIWDGIAELRAGRPIILRAVDIYMPLVQLWTQKGVMAECTACWEAMNDAARLGAEASGVPFLSRYDLFNGPNHDQDPREAGYILPLPDGEHPTGLGGEVTAQALAEMGYAPTIRP